MLLECRLTRRKRLAICAILFRYVTTVCDFLLGRHGLILGLGKSLHVHGTLAAT